MPPTPSLQVPIAAVVGPITAGSSFVVINASASVCPTNSCTYTYGVSCGGGSGRSWRRSLLGVAFATVEIKPNAVGSGISTRGQLAGLTCNVSVTVVDNGLSPPATSNPATTTLTVSPCAPKLMRTLIARSKRALL